MRPGVRETCGRQSGGVGRPAPNTILNEFEAFTTTEGAFVGGNGANWQDAVYTWDHRNRLTAATERNANGRATKQVEYDYDVYNRLLAKRVDADGNGTVDRGQTFIYDGTDIVLAFDQSGSLTNRYLYGPALDQVFADENAVDGILWALTDNQGTVRDIAKYDAAADTTSVVNHRKYDSFGRITSESNAALDFLFAYTGRFWDEDTQLQNNWNRWYDPRVGRWMSEDPIGFTAGDPNLYRYVGNSPLNFRDPFGLEVAGKGHMYPLYLGGSRDQIVFELTKAQHTAMHDYLREQGFGRDRDKTYNTAREKWKELSPEQRQEIVKEGMRRAGIPERMIAEKLDDVMKGDKPGVNIKRKTPRKSNVITADQNQEARKLERQAAKRLEEAGESAAKRLARKGKGALPGALGLLLGPLFFAENAEAKGVGRAALDEALDSIPFLDWAKAFSETTSGKDWVPAPGEEGYWDDSGSAQEAGKTTGPGVDIPDPIFSGHRLSSFTRDLRSWNIPSAVNRPSYRG